ncbi:MAG: hypothetical protein AABP62_03620 [Planctomycetota bacterium]
MATEVTCGQCHGRLLIETPGVVVACPHCGVHLSIPAPAPEPATQPEPILEQDTAVENPPAPGMPPTADDSGDIELNLEAVGPIAESPPSEVPVDPLASSSVFGGPDEHDQATESGWHSAPNLHVGPSESPSPPGAVGTEPSPASFTSPLMDSTPDPSPGSVNEPAMATFPTFGETPRTADPVWNFAPGEAATSAPADMFLSASQQFTLGAPADEPPDVPEQPIFGFGASPESSSFAAQARTITLPGESTEDLLLSSSQQFSLGAVAATIAAVDAAAADSTDRSESQSGSPVLASPPVLASAAAPVGEAAASQQKVLILLLLVVGSYASAITIVLIYLLAAGRTHQLESLPDLKPPMKKGEVSATFYSPKNDLPAGHVLKLGQSQRFGSVLVTPVRVTRGPVKFEHYSGKSALERTDTQPLLKLWLKFENVSLDQTFSPLDDLLIFKRSTQNKGEKVFANNFLVAAENRKLTRSVFHVYDMPPHSEFAIIGQKLDTELPPGETWQTFVPSEEEALELKGDLVWRVHIRKGYHPKSLRGVTTLIDVVFHSNDIADDSDKT